MHATYPLRFSPPFQIDMLGIIATLRVIKH